jgi:hypothetical protein
MKMKISWEIHSIDYQLKENEKYYKLEQQDVIGAMVKREKLDINSVFIFEEWMMPIIEKNIIENFFHFDRALRLIKVELKFHDFKNYDLLTEFDLRTKWTQIELNKFRCNGENFFYDENLPIKNINNLASDKENKEDKVDEKAISNLKVDEQAKTPISIIEEKNEFKLEHNEEIINSCTQSSNVKINDNNIYDDIGQDDIIYLSRTQLQTNIIDVKSTNFNELD